MEITNVRSAERIYAWNHSATVVNNSKMKRDYNLNEHVENSNLSAQDKNELLVKLTGKRKTMLEGAVFMLKGQSSQFDDFERALTLLNAANNSYGLGAVEAALQTQIDVIREMNTPEMTQENKALCLYTLQNMIFALSDYNLKNGKENNYTPKILQDQYQTLLKGASLNLDWDNLYNSVYSSEYQNANNPTLANWKFLDYDLIKNNMEKMAHYQAVHDESLLGDLRTKKAESQQEQNAVSNSAGVNGVKSWGTVELNKTSDQEINRILNHAMLQFNSKNLKDNLPDFFNFVKNSLDLQTANDEVNYPILHEVVLSAMHKIVNIGNEQQKKNLQEQSQQATEGMSL